MTAPSPEPVGLRAVLHDLWLRIHVDRFDDRSRTIDSFYAGVLHSQHHVEDVAREQGIDRVFDHVQHPEPTASVAPEVLLCSQCGEQMAAMVKVGTRDGWCTVCLEQGRDLGFVEGVERVRAVEAAGDGEREALARVICLAHHGAGCKPWDEEDEAWRETYRDMAEAVLAAGWSRGVPEGETVEEWGSRSPGASGVAWVGRPRLEVEELVEDDEELVRRTRTRYADRVTPWVPVDDHQGVPTAGGGS